MEVGVLCGERIESESHCSSVFSLDPVIKSVFCEVSCGDSELCSEFWVCLLAGGEALQFLEWLWAEDSEFCGFLFPERACGIAENHQSNLNVQKHHLVDLWGWLHNELWRREEQGIPLVPVDLVDK
jgi:hypothetical protein